MNARSEPARAPWLPLAPAGVLAARWAPGRFALHLALALFRLSVLLFVGLGGVRNASAGTARVDDSGTIVSQSVVPMRWKQIVPGRGADHSVQASVRVAARLNLAPWLNRPVHLYMGLAPSTGEPVYATWRTQGRLLAGGVGSGGRVLVFEGVAKTASLEETMDLTLTTDGRDLVSPQALQFYFEVDTP